MVGQYPNTCIHIKLEQIYKLSDCNRGAEHGGGGGGVRTLISPQKPTGRRLNQPQTFFPPPLPPDASLP